MTDKPEILIAEDSPTQAEQLSYLLETNGYRVRVATDGHQALAALRERLPALVVTDIVMPGMNGYELCEQVKSDKALRDVPVILLTSLSAPEDVVRSLQCGADNFIRKPYDEHYLLARISNILTSRELRLSGKLQVGLEVYLAGEKHFINAERQQILDFLLSTYEEVAQINDELAAQNVELEAQQLEIERAMEELDAERRHAEQQANLKRAVLDATVDGIALFDPAGNQILSNAALARLIDKMPGVAAAGSVTESLEAIASLAADPAGLRTFADSLAADPEREASLDLELPDAELWLDIFAAPVRDASGSLIGRIMVARDVTREREVERLKSDLVATVSHELRTPLASVLGFSELLLRHELDDESRRKYAETIASEAQRLTALVNDFLDLHRIEQGRLDLVPESLDLREAVRHEVEMFSGQSAAHVLTLDLPERPLLVNGDRGRLSQVVANLLSNAIKYSPEGGPVDVTAHEQDGFATLAVRDHGLGIPAEQQHKIFTKFFRVDSSDTRRIGGTGLGLTLCREIIEAHGGEIGFESSEHEGSTFWFRLPAGSPPA